MQINFEGLKQPSLFYVSPYFKGTEFSNLQRGANGCANKVAFRKFRAETLISSQPNLQNLFIEKRGTITDRYLDQIKLNPEAASWWAEFETSTYFPFFMKIATEETEQVFGYHGASQEFRLFQDVLKVVFEEKLGIELPENFYFLRLPSEEFYYDGNNVRDLFLREKPPHIDPALLPYALEYFLLRLINQAYELQLNSKNFTPQAIGEVEFFLDNIRKANQQYFNNPFHREVETPVFPVTLCKELSEQTGADIEEIILILHQLLIEEYRGHSLESFDDYLRGKFDVNLVDIRRIPEEEQADYLASWAARMGHVGELSINWHNYFYHFYDATSESAARVLSMVGPLFSGSIEPDGETCLEPFLRNNGYEGHEIRLEAVLERFCVGLGMEPGIASKMMEEGRRVIEASGNDKGVIFQFYDTSSKLLAAADLFTYLSMGCGRPVYHAENLHISSYVDESLVTDLDTQVQIRMILDNSTSLNPFGPLRMIRYDALPEGTGEVILNALKKCLDETNSIDPLKIAHYKEELQRYWI